MVQLEYEAYVSMAQSELRKIYTDIRARLVPVTEASVIISISSPHRGDSLEAVQFCIDTLKATVHIWKKEVYEADKSCWKRTRSASGQDRVDL
ncbi:molybdopterin synthase catalytic subunit [Coregonus clupeaformis]|nr:molybdopterin synthase catalytic subunit [Coregonus clupeaformis]